MNVITFVDKNAARYCPECGHQAKHLHETQWTCTYCHWHGVPDKKSFLEELHSAFDEIHE